MADKHFRQSPSTYVVACVKNRAITKMQNDPREAQHDHREMENNHKETQTDHKLMQNNYYSFLFSLQGPIKFYLMQCFPFSFDCMTTNSQHLDWDPAVFVSDHWLDLIMRIQITHRGRGNVNEVKTGKAVVQVTLTDTGNAGIAGHT